jgi:hypothetical protein
MALYELKVRYSMGGSGNRNSWTNVENVEYPGPLTDADLETVARGYVTALRPVVLTLVTIVSVTIKALASKGQGYNPNAVKTIGIGLTGQKAIGTEQAEIKEVVLHFNKNAASGRAGRLMIRMAIYDNEVRGGSDGEPTAAGVPAAVGDVQGTLNGWLATAAANPQVVTKDGNTYTGRAVTSYTFVRVTYRSARSHRQKKKPAETVAGLKLNFQDAMAAARVLIAGYALTRGQLAPAAALAADALIGPWQGATDVFDQAGSANLDVFGGGS